MTFFPRSVMSVGLITALSSGCGLLQKKNKNKGEEPTANPTCVQQNIKSIERPIIPGDENSGKFTYRFQVDMPPSEDAPLLVYIPGGPGQSGFEKPDSKHSYPKSFGVMHTDPRGVACNYVGDEQPQEFYNSEYVADDILAAVKSLGVKNYIIYGISYGTVVATIAGSKAESAGLETPRAVVLEGILPEMIRYTDDFYAKFWDEQLAKRSDALRERFKTGDYPLGLKKKQWATLIRDTLMIGIYRTKDGQNVHFLEKFLAYAENPTEAERKKIEKWLSKFTDSDESEEEDNGFLRFYVEIACAEIWDKVGGFVLNGDKFGLSGKNLCKELESETGVKFASRPYSAAKWKIRAPVYYYQGKKDPATPYEHAVKHVDMQSDAKTKSFMAVERGGHNPFELQMNNCTDSVWQALAKGPGEFKKELNNCQTPGLALKEFEGGKLVADATLIPDDNSKYAEKNALNSIEIDPSVIEELVRKVRIPGQKAE